MRSKETLVGLVFFVGLILLAAATLLIRGLPGGGPRIDGLVDSAEGLLPGDIVWVDGVELGRIDTVRLDLHEGRPRVRLRMAFHEPVTIHEDYRFEVKNSAILGGKIVALTRGDPSRPPAATPLLGIVVDPLKALERLDSAIAENRDDLRATIQRLRSFIERMDREVAPDLRDAVGSAKKVLAGIEKGEGTIGKLVKDDAIAGEVKAFFEKGGEAAESARNLLKKAEAGEGTVGKLLTDDTPFEDLKAALADVREIVGGVKEGKGTAGRLFKDSELYDNLSAAFKDLREVAGSLNEGKGTLGRLMKDPALHDKALAVLVDAKAVTASLRDGKGTLGKLINDDALYKDAKEILRHVRKVVEDLREQVPITSFTGALMGGL